MQRKIVMIIMVIMLCLAGCGNTDAGNDKNTNTQNEQGDAGSNTKDENSAANVELSMESLRTADETSEDQFKYFENKNGTYTISEYLGDSTIVVIPDEIGGIAVTEISSGVFSYNESLQAIRIGNNIEMVKSNAFLGCSALKYAIMGENVKAIGENAFSGCTILEEIELNNLLETIEFCAFVTLGDKLAAIRIPENVSTIELAFVPPTVVYVKEGSYAAEWVVDFVEKNPADAFEYVIE